MSRIHVIDSRAADLGLRICISPFVTCARHRTNDRRATGIWEVIASVQLEVAQVLGLSWCHYTRPAVVDDFGSLVFVGEPQ